MTRGLWIATLLVMLAFTLHALFPRYRVEKIEPYNGSTGLHYAQIDRWTETAVLDVYGPA